MEITQFTIQIIILGIPGILCYFIASKLVGHIGKDKFDVFLAIFLFSILSYILYGATVEVYNILFGENSQHSILTKIISDQKQISVSEILCATIASFFLAFIIAYLYNFNILNKFGRWIRATKRYGDEDVWHYFNNISSPKLTEWFIIRNIRADLMYLGNISTYSESGKDRELLIKNADVYKNSTGEYMYSADEIYLSVDRNEIIIEINSFNKFEVTDATDNKS